MRHLLFLPLLALLLSGCVGLTVGGGSGSVKDIQNAVAQACNFLPTAQTIAALLGKSIPVPQIVTSVCNAVTTRPLAEGPGRAKAPKVAGVTIRGQFLKKGL